MTTMTLASDHLRRLIHTDARQAPSGLCPAQLAHGFGMTHTSFLHMTNQASERKGSLAYWSERLVCFIVASGSTAVVQELCRRVGFFATPIPAGIAPATYGDLMRDLAALMDARAAADDPTGPGGAAWTVEERERLDRQIAVVCARITALGIAPAETRRAA